MSTNDEANACMVGALTVFKSTMFVVDVGDAILDYIATADLVDKGYENHAIWLGESVRKLPAGPPFLSLIGLGIPS